MKKNINYLDHPYWIPKCLNVGWISIPLQMFPYIYFPQIFTQIGCMIENVKIPIFYHTILVFWLFQNLLILSHLSESLMFLQGVVVSSIVEVSVNKITSWMVFAFMIGQLNERSLFAMNSEWAIIICNELGNKSQPTPYQT